MSVRLLFTEVLEAAPRDDAAAMERALAAGLHVAATTAQGTTLLHVAAASDAAAVVRCLCLHGAAPHRGGPSSAQAFGAVWLPLHAGSWVRARSVR